MLTYGENTDAWEESNANLEEKQNGQWGKIELTLCFEELRERN